MATTTTNGPKAISPTALAAVIMDAIKKQSLRPAERVLVLAALVRKMADAESGSAKAIVDRLITTLDLDTLDKYHLAILGRDVLDIDADLAEQLGMDYSALRIRCDTLTKAGYLRCIGAGTKRHPQTRYGKRRYLLTDAGKERAALAKAHGIA